jgi:hypothetical protein
MEADLLTVETGWDFDNELHCIVYMNYLTIKTALHAEPV